MYYTDFFFLKQAVARVNRELLTYSRYIYRVVVSRFLSSQRRDQGQTSTNVFKNASIFKTTYSND